MKHLLLAVGLLSLAVLAPQARAGDDEPGPSRFFDTYDKDKDGRVTPDELDVDPEIFRLLDRDGDGAITPQDLGTPREFRPRPGAGPGGRGGPGAGPGGPGGPGAQGGPPRLMDMDADGDGKVSREEFRGPPDAFDRLDTNGDGSLDRTECEQARRGPGGFGGRGAPGGGPGNRLLERLRQLDKDGDGKVSAEEYQGRIPFERLDRNGDGFLDEQDAPQDRGGRGQGGRGRGLSPQALQRFDRDGDGKVTREEFPGGDERFDALDVNGDGVLTEADLQAPPQGPPGDAPGGGADAPGPDALRAVIDRDDEDGDGRVSKEEYRGPAHLFDEMDRNDDGFLDAQDLPKR